MFPKPIASLFLLLLFLGARLNAQTVDGLVLDGRAFLAARNLTNALQRFQQAVALQPTNETAQAFLGATRLLTLVERAEFQQLLNRASFTTNGRTLFSWKSEPQFDTNGIANVDPSLNVMEPFQWIRSAMADEIGYALTNLTSIRSPQFLLTLRDSETGSGAMNVDYADVQMLIAGLHLFRSSLLLVGSWDFSVTWSRIRSGIDAELPVIQQLLEEFPGLLGNAAPEIRAQAKTELLEACLAYFQASALIRARNNQLDRLFAFVAEDLEAEDEFYAHVAALRTSLEAPTAIPSLPDEMVFMAPLFEATNPLRRFVPAFQDNSLVLGSWSDRTFDGITKERSERDLARLVGQLTFDMNGRERPAQFAAGIPRVQVVPGAVRLSLPAFDGFVFGIERSTNLISWETIGIVVSSDTPAEISDPRPESFSSRYYRFTDVSDRVVAYGTVRNRRTLAPVANASICVQIDNRQYCATSDSRGGYAVDFGTGIPTFVSGSATVTAPGYSRLNQFLYRQAAEFEPTELLLDPGL